MIRMPLQYQILIALIAGSVLGICFNPGDITLDDISVNVETIEDGIRVTSRDTAGTALQTELFDDIAGFREMYPDIAEQYQALDVPEDLTVSITGRNLHFSEDGVNISLNYTRLHDGRTVITTDLASSPDEFSRSIPEWDEIYETHGGSTGSRIAIAGKYIGDIFLRLLKMVTVPLIVTSLISGVSGLGNTSRLGAMFGKTFLYYLSTSLLAITTGIAAVNIIQPGTGAHLPGTEGATVYGRDQTLIGVFVDLINNMIPSNPVESLAGAEFLSIITFSILIGVFIIRTGGSSAETMRNFFNSAFDVMMNLTTAIIRLAPIGVFGYMLYATQSQGMDIFKTLAWYMLSVFSALVVHATVVLPLILLFVARRSPWKYAQAMSPALMTAFSTASSNGTLPLTMTSVEKRAGVPNDVSSFVLPLGATINMDGTALYEAVAVLFIAQATPGFDMTLQTQIIVAVTALLASVGAAGIPHAGLVMMAIVLQAVGLPLEAQGIIIAVDRVLDMLRTAVNVWSDSCGCAVVARLEQSSSGAG